MNKLLIVSGVVAMAAVSQAQVIYNSFGAGQTYNFTQGWTISGANVTGAEFSTGFQFTSLETGLAGTLDIAIGNVVGPTSVVFSLLTDSGGELGTQIGDSITINTVTNSWGGETLLSGIDISGAGWDVEAGSTYWLYAKTGSPDAWNSWNQGGVTGRRVFFNQTAYSYSTTTQGAFQMEVVPEPTTMAVLAGGAALVALRRRKKA